MVVLNMAKNNALEKELFDASTTISCSNLQTNESKFNGYEKAIDDLVKELIRKILKIDGNDRCCDCDSPDPDWLVTNLGILVCIECCGIHREMGVQLSKTQSIKMDRLACSQLIVNKIFKKSFI